VVQTIVQEQTCPLTRNQVPEILVGNFPAYLLETGIAVKSLAMHGSWVDCQSPDISRKYEHSQDLTVK
jgi:hypothetical protein